MALVILMGRDDAVGQNVTRRVDIEKLVGVKELLVPEVVQGGEHGVIQHVMPVENGDRIAKVPCVHFLAVDTPTEFVFPFQIPIDIEVLGQVVAGLQDGIIDQGVGHIDPSVGIGIDRLQGLEIHGIIGKGRLGCSGNGRILCMLCGLDCHKRAFRRNGGGCGLLRRGTEGVIVGFLWPKEKGGNTDCAANENHGQNQHKNPKPFGRLFLFRQEVHLLFGG